MSDVRVKRVYEDADRSDGRRVLVDRVWPRGVSRERAALDEWRPELAPSDDLRRWFGHDPERFEEFRARYRAELADRGDELSELIEWAQDGPLTLVYGARDERHNNAVVLAELLDEQ